MNISMPMNAATTLKKVLGVLSLCLVVLSSVYGQVPCATKSLYIAGRSVSDSLLKSKDYESAVAALKVNLSNSSDQNPVDLIELSKCYYYLDRQDSALHFFSAAVESGYLPNSIERFYKVEPWQTIQSANAQQWSASFELLDNRFQRFSDKIAQPDAALINKLERLEQQDQLYRSPEWISRMKEDSMLKDSILLLQGTYDRANQQELQSIIDSLGAWPGYNTVGKEGEKVLWLIVQHADNDVQFQFFCLNKIYDELLKKNSNPNSYAYLMDRIHINRVGLQEYGTQFKLIYDDDNKVVDLKFKPLIYSKSVTNSMRKLVGMPELSVYKRHALKHFQNK